MDTVRVSVDRPAEVVSPPAGEVMLEQSGESIFAQSRLVQLVFAENGLGCRLLRTKRSQHQTHHEQCHEQKDRALTNDV